MRARPPRLYGFVIGSHLGSGATCDVYSALDTTGRHGWAVKVLRDDAASDPTNVQLLKREFRAGLALRHANLVRMLRSGPDDDCPRLLVMERISGQSVRAILQQNGWLKPPFAANIGRQIAAALAAMHSAGYVHGDVKPDNLHLRPDGAAILLDLGFTHRPSDDELLGIGYVLGTANYVAPELCTQPEEDGPASDVYSLGITLFELLTGELPYATGGVQETMQRHRDRRPDSLHRWTGNWPEMFGDLVDSMLARSPGDRPTARTVERVLASLYPNWSGQSFTS